MTLARFFLALSFFLPGAAFAALDAELTIKPEHPAPYEQVKVTLSSYSFDVNTATITWTSGSRTLLSGFGEKSITLTMGALGTVIPLSYTATTARGDVVSGSISLSPQSVELLYETKESYVPPFYKGKALPGEGAILRITAFPMISEGGTILPPSGLAYSWYINGEYAQKISGAGKQTASVPMHYLTTTTDVRVLVRSPLGNSAEKTISISPRQILPVLYEHDEALGTNFSNPFFRRMELSKDITLALEPFYFSTNGALETTSLYGWYLDGLPITPQEKTMLTLKPSEGAFGTRVLSIALENSKRLLQRGETAIEIVFDARN